MHLFRGPLLRVFLVFCIHLSRNWFIPEDWLGYKRW